MKVLVIQTGGTIDKDYPKRIGGYAFEIGEPAARRILERVQSVVLADYVTICREDSQDIKDDHRQAVLQQCKASQHEHILITHGTDTILETAAFIAQAQLQKTIVLTGSFKPETFKDSDAEFNLGMAMGALQTLSTAGVVMSGGVYPWNEVVRDSKSGAFILKDVL